MGRFDGKAALVTGGGTGIGRAVAAGIADEGGSVVVAGRRLEPLRELAATRPDRIRCTQADVAQSGDVQRAVAFTVEQLGGLDVLVNNAGLSHMGPLSELSDGAMRAMLDINVLGPLVAMREALPHLIARRGCIVNVTSVTARGAAPGMAAYGGTKAALEQITRALAVEVGPAGVRVNVVAPGLTITDMAREFLDEAAIEQTAQRTPLRRAGTPEDVAEAVLFLASDNAAWITGQVVQSSGGLAL